MDIRKDVIGIVGGMGSYATLNIFKRILDAFEANKEWDRPRIIIDNYATLPSRSRALLYNEQYDVVLNGLSNSVKNLIHAGANIIILGSNTGHLFLEEIYKKVPESRGLIVNFIELLGKDVKKENIKEVLLLGTEATVDFNIYKNHLSGIKVLTPSEEKVKEINYFIEVVKQNIIKDEDITNFKQLLISFKADNIILGCTELPVLYEKKVENININVFDPINSFINYLK
ncbi:MAG: amino acid racemase [Acholeplasmataceae bacterium]|jgi:aspartate racemase|nr:amino acid racemase [Bacteroidales bacterium]